MSFALTLSLSQSNPHEDFLKVQCLEMGLSVWEKLFLQLLKHDKSLSEADGVTYYNL